MKIIRAKDYKDMSRKAANIISAQVIMKPNCVLGLATGLGPGGAPRPAGGGGPRGGRRGAGPAGRGGS